MSDALPDHRADTKVKAPKGEIPTRAKSRITYCSWTVPTICLKKAWPLNDIFGAFKHYSGSWVDVKLSQSDGSSERGPSIAVETVS